MHTTYTYFLKINLTNLQVNYKLFSKRLDPIIKNKMLVTIYKMQISKTHFNFMYVTYTSI